MSMTEDERDEKIGRAALTFSMIVYAIGFIFVVSLIALVVLFIIGKPLWIAPLIGIGAYIGYRLILTLILRLLG